MTRSSPRLDEVDVVRGVALGGMLLVNLGVFSGAALIPLARQTGLDWLATSLALLLAQGKFYPLFAFLFGWGIARQQRSTRNGYGASAGYPPRRMAALALIGLLHAALLWQGDILFAYAVLGLLLPLLRRAPVKMMAGFIALVLLLSAFLQLPGAGQTFSMAYREWITPPLNAFLGVPGQPGPSGIISQHLIPYLWKLAYFPEWLGNFAALILLGYLAGQSRVRNMLSLRAALLIAIPLNLLYVLARVEPGLFPVDWTGFVRTASISLGGPLLALAYALGVIRWYRSLGGKSWLESLRRIGRMPLTVYLSQSLICAALFAGVRPGQFAPALVWPVAGGIFFIQVLFAHWWLERFERGPLETAWRWLADPRRVNVSEINREPREKTFP